MIRWDLANLANVEHKSLHLFHLDVLIKYISSRFLILYRRLNSVAVWILKTDLFF